MATVDKIKLICCLVVLAAANAAMGVSDFAVELVGYSGSFGPSPYNDPCAVLGKPATVCKNLYGYGLDPNFRVKLVEPAYYVDLNDKKVITTLNPGDTITVKFDHKVVDYPGNLYGIDLIVFGNSWFGGAGNINDNTNMNTYFLTSIDQNDFEKVEVSVSQDGSTWYSFSNGPWADDLYPTQAYKWDRTNAHWTNKEMDFAKPVDPNLDYTDFVDISAADAIDLYNGSGGGTGYDLRLLADYNNLAIDPNTGYRWIQYVRFTGVAENQGEIDAVSDAAACGDPTHPYPPGDLNKDCRVDLADLKILADNWLASTHNCETYPAGDLNEDCSVDFTDFAILAQNYLACTYNCDP
ncbi:MAG: dockerin type I domain-containing protein [Sedimentisphaerales bacterium]